jgi:hypothetical protein
VVRIAQVRRRHTAPGARARRARNRRTLWAAGILAVILLAGSYMGQRVNTRPPVVQALSESEVGATLLPVADPIKPLRGTHDMSSLPAQLPQAQPAPEGVEVPRVDVPKASFDFGVIPADPPVSYIFAIQNTGTAPLHLSNLVTSCGCTTAELSSSVIPPGRRADLQVVFDPDYHETVGPVTRMVWMVSDDPTQPWLELQVVADVRPDLTP